MLSTSWHLFVHDTNITAVSNTRSGWEGEYRQISQILSTVVSCTQHNVSHSFMSCHTRVCHESIISRPSLSLERVSFASSLLNRNLTHETRMMLRGVIRPIQRITNSLSTSVTTTTSVRSTDRLLRDGRAHPGNGNECT